MCTKQKPSFANDRSRNWVWRFQFVDGVDQAVPPGGPRADFVVD